MLNTEDLARLCYEAMRIKSTMVGIKIGKPSWEESKKSYFNIIRVAIVSKSSMELWEKYQEIYQSSFAGLPYCKLPKNYTLQLETTFIIVKGYLAMSEFRKSTGDSLKSWREASCNANIPTVAEKGESELKT